MTLKVELNAVDVISLTDLVTDLLNSYKDSGNGLWGTVSTTVIDTDLKVLERLKSCLAGL